MKIRQTCKWGQTLIRKCREISLASKTSQFGELLNALNQFLMRLGFWFGDFFLFFLAERQRGGKEPKVMVGAGDMFSWK